MKKKLNGKLVLTKETLRTLAQREMDAAQGGAPTRWCTTGQSNTDTCASCYITCTENCP